MQQHTIRGRKLWVLWVLCIGWSAQAQAQGIGPSGIIYQVREGVVEPVVGAQVFLVDADSGVRLPQAQLFGTQQGQVTTVQGLYRFDIQPQALPGRFAIEIIPPAALTFPSQQRPPVGASASDDLGAFTAAPADGRISPDAFPKPEGGTYYLRFDLQGSDPNIINNHIPLDAVADAISISASAQRSRVSVGDLVAFTVRLQNGLRTNFTGAGAGSLSVQLPEGLQWVRGSGRAQIVSATASRSQRVFVQSPSDVQPIQLGPLDIPARASVNLRLMARVMPRGVGSRVTRFALQDQQGGALTTEAAVRVDVVADPLFDEATVLGTVHCTAATGGMPVIGARMYLDTGYRVDTDGWGKFHFRGIPAGRHIIKLDPGSLAYGAKVVSENPRVFYSSKGLLTRLQYEVDCAWEKVTGSLVRKPPGPPLFRIDLGQAQIQRPDKTYGFPKIDAWVSPHKKRDEEGASWRLSADVAHVHVKVPKTLGIESWEWTFFDTEGKVALALEGDAPPYQSAPLPKEAHQYLQAGKTYRYRLALITFDGIRMETPWRAIEIGEESSAIDSPVYEAFAVIDAKRVPKEMLGQELRITPQQGSVVEFRQPSGMRIAWASMPEEGHEQEKPERGWRIHPVDWYQLHDDERSPLPFQHSACAVDNPVVQARNGAATGTLAIHWKHTEQAQRWSVALKNEKGGVLATHQGEGAPPATWDWDLEAAKVPLSQTLSLHCSVGTDQARMQLAPVPLVPSVPAPAWERTFRGTDYPTPENIPDGLRKGLAEASVLVSQHPGAYVEVEIHTDSGKGFSAAQLETARTAIAIGKVLSSLGLVDSQFNLKPLGATQPLFPGALSRRIIEKNRRVVVTVRGLEAPKVALPLEQPAVAATVVSVQGNMLLEDDDGFVRVPPRVDSGVVVTRGDGARLQLGFPDTETAKPLVAAAKPTRLLGSTPDTLADPQLPPDKFEQAPAPAKRTKRGELVVWLPKKGAPVAGDTLSLRGRAPLGTDVRVNDRPLPLAEDGQFTAVIDVKGQQQPQVNVTAQDQDGWVDGVSRSYKRSDKHWFVMALADTAIGTGAKIEGMNERTSAPFAGEIYAHGRMKLYLKGRIKGSALWRQGPFDEYRLTAHVDTGKKKEAQVLEQVIDPERYYPVYGDSTEDVQEVSSRERMFVLLEADGSSIRVGNFAVTLRGIELFRFHRSGFGAVAKVDETWREGLRTEATAFVSDDFSRTAHRQIALRGTGGIMFFLGDRNIIEGSERVEIVIRDEVTGTRLHSVLQTPDVDYRMKYSEGRLVFDAPIPSTVSSGWRLNRTPMRSLHGHAVFVEVEYDYQGATGDRQVSFGAHARQHIGDLKVGAGVVSEDRSGQLGSGARYELVSAEAQLSFAQHGAVRAEVARSWRSDSDQWTSLDGGITNQPLGFGKKKQGYAGRLEIAWGELGPRQREEPVSEGKKPGNASTQEKEPAATTPVPVLAYLEHQGRGFHAGGSILEQGQTKFGAQGRYKFNDQNTLRLRHDTVWSDVPPSVGSTQRLRRHLTAAGWTYTQSAWLGGVEASHTHSRLQSDQDDIGMVTLFGERSLTPRLRIRAEQEFIPLAQSPLVSNGADRLATGVGATYELNDTFTVDAQARSRWNGTHSAQLGLRSSLSDGLRFYVSERLTGGRGVSQLTSVVGADSEPNPGSRSYAEYQMDGLVSGQRGRAVLGMDNRWTVRDDLELQLAYERSSLVGRSHVPDPSQTGGVVGPGGTGYGSGLLSPHEQFAASSYASSATFPVGVASRDALAAGVRWEWGRTLSAIARGEFRYDRSGHLLNIPDRTLTMGHVGLDWRFQHDLVALARAQGAMVRNADLQRTDGAFMDLSVGVALRSPRLRRVAGLFKYTRRFEHNRLHDDGPLYEVSDVVALETAVEVGWGFQTVGKLGVKSQLLDVEGGATKRNTLVLALGRLNYHVFETIDAGAEYRVLANTLDQDTEHGALCEVAWLPVRGVSVGVGYNFTGFDEDLLANPNVDHHGVFLRVTGSY